jgi:hypothetical protein
MFLSGASEFECVSNDAVDRAASEDDFLNGHVGGGVAIDASAYLGIFAFAVFADDDEIDVSCFAVRKRTDDSLGAVPGAD